MWNLHFHKMVLQLLQVQNSCAGTRNPNSTCNCRLNLHAHCWVHEETLCPSMSCRGWLGPKQRRVFQIIIPSTTPTHASADILRFHAQPSISKCCYYSAVRMWQGCDASPTLAHGFDIGHTKDHLLAGPSLTALWHINLACFWLFMAILFLLYFKLIRAWLGLFFHHFCLSIQSSFWTENVTFIIY